MPQQQTKSDFDWKDFSRSDWVILAAVLGTVVAVAVVIFLGYYMGYGKELLQAAQSGAHKMQEHARNHYIAEKIGQGIEYISEHSPKWFEVMRGYFREHPPHPVRLP
jgi:hypothetical protein